MRRSRQLERMTLLLSLRSAPTGMRYCLLPPWLVEPRKRSTLYVVWTAMANVMRQHKIERSRRLECCVTKVHTQDFAGPISFRTSKVLGPISRYRVADILLHMELVSRASRPGLIVGLLFIFCNVLDTAQRFHAEGFEQTCRVGCPNEPDSLNHYNERPLLNTVFLFLGRPQVFHVETICSTT